jgi:hypothetical protein
VSDILTNPWCFLIQRISSDKKHHAIYDADERDMSDDDDDFVASSRSTWIRTPECHRDRHQPSLWDFV